MREPLLTERAVLVDKDEGKSEIDLAKPLMKKRTPLPTLPQARVFHDDRVKRLAAARKRAARREKLLATVGSDADHVDPNQTPAMQGADGVVLISGKYRCNICGSRMKNEKLLIKCHNSKLHPKDPIKSSAYLRQQARRPSPCPNCDKICSSIEMLKKHFRQAHSQVEPTPPATP
ncbi:hypothetical protein ANO14919_086840 [Xylariales sp. No.14919]|nr:hypothetical protein F5X98DRAFT_178357 [Xylaria grammica]GAW19200.1 hypothetical protein ANO14919_086840 [Xylariales sp. No.14919]